MTTAFGTDKAKCVFEDSSITFAISTRNNLFELGSLFRSFTDSRSISFLNEFLSILKIVECFKMDEDTKL